MNSAGWLGRFAGSFWLTLALGVGAFLLVAIRFSPNWFSHRAERSALVAHAASEPERAAVHAAFESTVYLVRGGHVARQVADLSAAIPDRDHAILRWRLLFPALGRVTGLPGEVILGFSHLGCAWLAVYLVWIRRSRAVTPAGAAGDAFWMAVVIASTAPFFTSMAWLGYYDACLALALLGVGFARNRRFVLLATLLGPWIDERFVLGFPLACAVRWAVVSPGAAGGFLSWLRAELLAPTCALAVFLVVRLSLGGAGGSQTIGEYVRDFVGNRSFDLPRLLHGAWAGLRVAWLPLLLLPFLLWHAGSGRPWRRAFAAALPALVALTLGIALGTALDLSRSMVLLLPAAVLAWLTASETDAWRRYRLAPLLGIGALALPASHVVSRFVLPVDAFWRPPLSVADALNHLGNAFRTGTGVAQSAVRAVHCFERAAAAGLPAAMANLGFMHAGGHGVPKNRDVALQWYRRAAQRDSFEGQSLLALAYFHGDGVTADPVLARHWFDRAAAQGHAPAETNLATMLLGGLGGPQDAAGAIRWYRRAAAKGEARSAAALGDIYSSGQAVPVDTPRALAWLEVAARLGHADGMGNIGVIFINGSGVAVDRVEALAWFALAANRGSARFAAYRDRLRGELGTAELAAAEARAHAIAVRLAHSDPAQRIFRSDSEPAR